MILRPVRPVSPIGPPLTNRPVGLMWNTHFLVSSISAGMVGRMTCSIMSLRIRSALASAACWVEITTVSTATGLPSAYRTVTCDLPSGRR